MEGAAHGPADTLKNVSIRVRVPALPDRSSRRTLLTSAVITVALSASACSPGDEGPEPPGLSADGRDVTFEGGGFTVEGSFTHPESPDGEPVPGALIISGSGPTNRNGNSDGRPEADTNLNLSRVLAGAGVASLRYDKFGSGDPDTWDEKTVEAMGEDIDPLLFDAQMAAAYEELITQPEVDPERTLIVGHSEGALFALRAREVLEDADPALVLAAPPGARMLDVIDRQITEQVRTAEAQGAVNESDAAMILSDIRTARALVRAGDELDMYDPTGIFAPQNQDFLAWIDAFDPVDLARDLPDDTPVLVLWGEEDAQIPRDEIDRLMTGFEDAERVDLPGTDHVLREYDDSPGAAALDGDRPFSPDVAPALERFVDGLW
ncbi:alpha/beta hydrolase [Nocardiopsis alba]